MTSTIPDARASRPPRQPLVLMRFRPVWTYIDGIREFCRFFRATTFSGEITERASVVVQETLENAVKYSTGGEDSELELVIESRGSSIDFSVSSILDPTHLGDLRDELSSIALQTPEEAYVAAFLRAASAPESVSRSGLARIRHEGRAEITLKEEGGGPIRITATSTL